MNPIHSLLERIWASGHTPRIVLDARREGVIVPEHVRRNWAGKLVLDLDANYPLELEMNHIHLQGNFAFKGHVARCTVPWGAVYGVINRDTGEGAMLVQNVPPDWNEKTPMERRAALTVIKGGLS